MAELPPIITTEEIADRYEAVLLDSSGVLAGGYERVTLGPQ